MILGFKEQFIEKINNGEKIHTIRIDKYNRWEVGMLAQMCVNVRTKNHFQFNEATIQSIQDILICQELKSIYIDDKQLTDEKIYDLAVNDGFESIIQFWQFFKKNYPEHLYLSAKILHWTNLKY